MGQEDQTYREKLLEAQYANERMRERLEPLMDVTPTFAIKDASGNDPAPPQVGPSGRHEGDPLPYRDALTAAEADGTVHVLDNVLEAEAVYYTQPEPSDPLDDELAMEDHCATCADCASAFGQICAHCLELRICKNVPVRYRLAPNVWTWPPPDRPTAVKARFETLQLCRRCRNSARAGSLEVVARANEKVLRQL